MQKIIQLTLLLIIISLTTSAQYRYRGRMYGGNEHNARPRMQPDRQRQAGNFKPSLNLSIGYGFPNLDKNNMLDFYNYYPGKAQQQGPYIGSLDYQFSRSMSVGVTVIYGKLTVPYYYANDINSTFTGKLENTAVMLNLTRNMPGSKVVTPYFKTAIGVNIPHSSYTNTTGTAVVVPTDDNTLAYQASFGAKFNVSQRAGLFVEAGYGKYIVAGGLAFRF